MRTHQNARYVQTQGAYVGRDHETGRVKVEGEVRLTVRLHHLEGIVCFGRVSVSPGLLAVCAERPLHISYLSEHGRFLARVGPATSGKVLVRRRQYRLGAPPGHRDCGW